MCAVLYVFLKEYLADLRRALRRHRAAAPRGAGAGGRARGGSWSGERPRPATAPAAGCGRSWLGTMMRMSGDTLEAPCGRFAPHVILHVMRKNGDAQQVIHRYADCPGIMRRPVTLEPPRTGGPGKARTEPLRRQNSSNWNVYDSQTLRSDVAEVWTVKPGWPVAGSMHTLKKSNGAWVVAGTTSWIR